MSDYKDKDYSLYPKSGGGRMFKSDAKVLSDRGEREYREVHGVVETPHGFVIANSYFYEGRSQSSSLEMIRDGRSYHRYFKKYYTQRGLVTKGKQFANDVFADA